MGIDVGSAYSRKAELYECAAQLKSVRNKLEQYKGTFGSSWQGEEIPYFMQAIDKTKKDITSAISEIEGIGNAIVSAAEEIKREEEAAAKKAKEEAEKAKAAAKQVKGDSGGGGSW